MTRLAWSMMTRLFSIVLLGLLAACAQQSEPGYYETPRGSTQTDAADRARGDGAGTVAPSQLQFGFGQQQAQAPSQAAESGQAEAPVRTARQALPAELADTRSYLGTIPCPPGSGCTAMRISLTLAPDGQWRARRTPLDGGGAPAAQMGCWHLIGTQPTRIVLQTGEQSLATLRFQQSNVLAISWLSGKTPLLESHLTRQADIDPIPELSGQPAVSC
ncbi:copper resistance protein NlpE N-terminal domain-containing protein [Castellaniella sp.]|uniref:copper resistance protein NlpE N-terminal domain-containing protein n=1 Tax=Castellaniella sp. TaxID=1955812 RepID=UPI003565B383